MPIKSKITHMGLKALAKTDLEDVASLLGEQEVIDLTEKLISGKAQGKKRVVEIFEEWGLPCPL